MVGKEYVLKCDWCGDIRFGGNSITGLSHYYYVYRFKSVSPLSDELWLSTKYNRCACKYLGFCSEECAEEYFKENPEDKKFYNLMKRTLK